MNTLFLVTQCDQEWPKLGVGRKFKPPEVHRFPQKPIPFLLGYVQELLLKKVIEPVNLIRFQACLFCVDKNDSSRKRVILDLLSLNKRIHYN